MSVPIFYPTLQPGTCDAGVTYTFELLARNASVFSTTTPLDAGATAVIALHAVDGMGSALAAPGDMAVRMQFTCYDTPWFDVNRTYTVPFVVADNASNAATANQTFVVRKWTAASSVLAFTTTGVSSPAATFTLAAHGLSVGDRVYITYAVNPLIIGSAPTNTPAMGTVTAVSDANHFTVTTFGPAGGPASSFLLGEDGHGHQVFIYTLAAKQTGTNQSDITSAASVSGTRGMALTYLIVTNAVSGITASGVPDGVGMQGALLSGTPVEAGWFPVVLIAGTMQRLCLFSIAPGTYDDLLVAPSVVNAIVGRTVAAVVTAPSLTGLSTNWVLANAPSGVALTGSAATQTTIYGTFIDPGSYSLTVTASGGLVLVSKTITFVVTAGQPVVNNPGDLSVTEATPVNLTLIASNAPASWALVSAPAWLSIDAYGNITGTPAAAGVYSISATATNSAGTSDPMAFAITVTALANYVPWLHGDLSLIDLQFDLRKRGVSSFYADSSGAIGLVEGDTCKLAVLLLSGTGGSLPAQVNDATTLWLTARTDADKAPVIDLQAAGSSVLTAVAGGSYYLLPVDLSADPILDAINDLDDPGDGTPAVLTLHAQLAVLRSNGQTARSQPFLLTIAQRLADAGRPPLNQY